MVTIHVHSLENFPTHEPTPFRNSRTKNERDGRGRFEGPHCGAFALALALALVLVLVLRPSMATTSTPTYVPGRTGRGSWSQFMSIFWKTFLPMNRLHFPIRGRRTSATDEDDLKDPIAALSPSSSSFVLRPSSVDGDEQHTVKLLQIGGERIGQIMHHESH